MLQKAAEFIKQCKPEETIVVYHKGCGDGIAAAAILGKFFSKSNGLPKRFIALGYEEDFEYFVKKILAIRAKNVVFADLSLDKYPELLETLAGKFGVLIIDHHTLITDMNARGILHIHPKFFSEIEGTKYCGAKLTYDICSKAVDMKDASWLAAVGIMHDVGSETWKRFLDEVYLKFPELKGGKDIYGFDSTLGQLVSLISSSKVGVAKEIRTITLCINTENPKDILELKSEIAKELNYWKTKSDKEISKYVADWRGLAEINEKLDLVILEVKTKLPVSSTISTILSLGNPNFVFCIYKVKSNLVNISFRSQKGLNCHVLAQEATKGFEFGSGGGHPQAAGARVLKKDFEVFKERLPKLVEQLRK